MVILVDLFICPTDRWIVLVLWVILVVGLGPVFPALDYPFRAWQLVCGLKFCWCWIWPRDWLACQTSAALREPCRQSKIAVPSCLPGRWYPEGYTASGGCIWLSTTNPHAAVTSNWFAAQGNAACCTPQPCKKGCLYGTGSGCHPVQAKWEWFALLRCRSWGRRGAVRVMLFLSCDSYRWYHLMCWTSTLNCFFLYTGSKD